MKEKSQNETQTSLTEIIKIEISNKDQGIIRNYKLNLNTKFEIFEDFLLSKIKTKKLDYVFDHEKCKLVQKEKLSEDRHRVRDIMVNKIDTTSYNRILNLSDTDAMFIKLKEYKRMRSRTNSISAKKDIYNLKFKSGKETVAEFWERFEEKI